MDAWQRITQRIRDKYAPSPQFLLTRMKEVQLTWKRLLPDPDSQYGNYSSKEALIERVLIQFASNVFTNEVQSFFNRVPKSLGCLGCGGANECERSHLVPRPSLLRIALLFGVTRDPHSSRYSVNFVRLRKLFLLLHLIPGTIVFECRVCNGHRRTGNKGQKRTKTGETDLHQRKIEL